MNLHGSFTFVFIILSVVSASTETNPFTPKAALLRYWNKEIRTGLPKSDFLILKASPLTTVQSALFAKLAAQNALSTQLPAFCSAANLLCFPELSPSLEKHDKFQI
ncbi:Polygalacturonase 1 beta-like protein 3 [Linum grandiflorum]